MDKIIPFKKRPSAAASVIEDLYEFREDLDEIVVFYKYKNSTDVYHTWNTMEIKSLSWIHSLLGYLLYREIDEVE